MSTRTVHGITAANSTGTKQECPGSLALRKSSGRAVRMEREERPCVQPDCNNGRRGDLVVLVKGALCSCGKQQTEAEQSRAEQSSAAQASYGDHQY